MVAMGVSELNSGHLKLYLKVWLVAKLYTSMVDTSFFLIATTL